MTEDEARSRLNGAAAGLIARLAQRGIVISTEQAIELAIAEEHLQRMKRLVRDASPDPHSMR